MRKHIKPEDYKGKYSDTVKPEDLLIMGNAPDSSIGSMPLCDGINEGLWHISLETGLGMIVDIRKIPLAQSEIDRCNREDINPYDIPSDERIYIVRPASEYHLRDDVRVIGYMTADKVCRVKNNDRISFLKS